jgi:uncharacterized protein
MDITPIIPEGHKIITGYGLEGFTISRETYTGSVLVLPSKVLSWPAVAWDENALITLEGLLEQEEGLEILLIGCGEKHGQLGMVARQRLKQKTMSLDSMSTGAACRTYNVLLSEGRKVGAGLIL